MKYCCSVSQIRWMGWLLSPTLIAFMCDVFNIGRLDFIYNPSSLNNIVNYWLVNESNFKINHIILWYYNVVGFNFWYLFYLNKNKNLIFDNIKKLTGIKLPFTIIVFLIIGWFIHSKFFFQIDIPMDEKLHFLLNSYFGFYVFLPAIFCFAVLSIFSSVIYLYYFLKTFSKDSL